MLSSLPPEVVHLLCSFLDENTFHSFTLTNSSYNQTQLLYQAYIVQNYSPELFGFSIWDHTVFELKGFLPPQKGNRTTSLLRWKDLFYRINSRKDLVGVGEGFQLYFKETFLDIIQRFNTVSGSTTINLSSPEAGYYLDLGLANSIEEELCQLSICYLATRTMIFETLPLNTAVGSVINDGNCLFDMLDIVTDMMPD
jgi:hypothetical protein